MDASFDVIGLGPGLEAALTVALMAKRGRRTMLAPGHRAHRITTWPEVLTGMDRPAVRRLLQELDLERFVDERLVPHYPAFQVLLPDSRIDVGPEDESLLDTLQRELHLPTGSGERLLFRLARASQAVERLLDKSRWPLGTPSEADIQHLEQTADWTQTAGDTVLQAVIRAPSAVTASTAASELGPLVLARLWSSWRQGTWTFTGGISSLELCLHKLIRESGGVVVAEVEPTSLEISDGEGLRAVVLEGRPGTSRAPHFVLGLQPDALLLPKMLGDRLPRPRLVARRHVLHLVLRRGWLPGSMARHLLFIDPSIEQAHPVRGLVSVPMLTDDEQVLTLEGALPLDRCDEAGLRVAEERMVQAVARVVPFFNDAFVRASSPHRERDVPLGAIYSVAWSTPSPLAGAPGLPLDLGLGGTAALVHPLVLGALGTEGAFAAALAAAELFESGRPLSQGL